MNEKLLGSKNMRENRQIRYKRLNKLLVYLSIILLFLLNLLFLFCFRTSFFAVNLSFLLNLIAITVGISLNALKKKLELFDTVFWSFSYIFFFIAPVVQTYNGHYPNTMLFNPSLVIRTNLLVFLFIITYFIAYRVVSIRSRSKNYKPYFPTFPFNKRVFYLLLVISVITFLLTRHYVMSKIMFGKFSSLRVQNLSTGLLLHKFLFSIPIFLVGFLLLRRDTFGKWEYVFIFLISLFLLFWFKNPFLERRNALGPAYLGILIIIFRKHLSNYKAFWLFILIFFIIYPISSVIVHSGYGISLLDSKEVLTTLKIANLNTLQGLDFDAWSEFMATIKYVDSFGITYGHQLLGVVLFFIPRHIWPAKPIGTGALVGNYLMSYYGMWFNNLSNPLPSEGYINFGAIGTTLFAIVFGAVTARFNDLFSFQDMNLFIGVYISVYMFYMLRGDLMSSFAYLILTLFGIYALPLILSKIDRIFRCTLLRRKKLLGENEI